MSVNKDIIIFSDFDGTITKRDVGNTLFTIFSGSKNDWIVEQWKKGNITSRACLECECVISRATENQFEKEVSNFKIDEYFIDFYNYIKSKDIPFYIFSDGIDKYINTILNNYSLLEIESYANSLMFKDNLLIPEFPYYRKGCGLCGNCKIYHFYKLAKGFKTTVYIGDGFSDRHISEKVDILFAKSALAEYCNSKGIKFYPFETFNNVINKLKTII